MLTTEQELRQKLRKIAALSTAQRAQRSVTQQPPRSTVFVERLRLQRKPNERSRWTFGCPTDGAAGSF